ARQREQSAFGRIVLIEVGLELAIAREHLQLVGEVHVDALREVPVVHLLGDRALPVVGVAGQVRQGQRLQQTPRNRIDLTTRNDVVAVRRSHYTASGRVDSRRERIVDVADAAAEN